MDSDWLGGLVDRYAAALELYARQWCHAPEDVVQEAFLKLVAQRPPPDQPAAWLFKVVRNGAVTQRSQPADAVTTKPKPPATRRAGSNRNGSIRARFA